MRSPFKFLDAYTLEDKAQFFGRGPETEELYTMAFKTPLLLVYGLSGTGKTSLIQCGLASRFDGPDWFPLFIRRQENINRSFREALRLAVEEPVTAPLPETIRQIYRRYLRPVFLIFDQFEELFILGTAEEQQQLAEDLKNLLKADLPCTIILSIREEYLGRLYPFEKAIPTLFDFRLRVEPMSLSKIEAVLSSSFNRFNISLEQPEEESLQLITDNLSAGKAGIQLPYLQVYLDMLYREDYLRTYGDKERADELPPLRFSRKEIRAFGSIEHVLEKFLHRQETTIQEQLSSLYPDWPEGGVQSVLDSFVTEEGTKRPVAFRYQEPDKHILVEESILQLLPFLAMPALSNCIEMLEQSRLVRFSDNIIELAHDSLASLIDEQRTDEQRQLNEIKRRVQGNFLDYQRTGEFLSRKQLNAYEEYLPLLSLEPEVLQYIHASQSHADEVDAEEKARQQRELELIQQKLETEKRAARRQRFLTIVTSLAAVVALVLGAWALYQRNEKEKSFFKIQMANAQSSKSQGNYEAAIEQIKYAAQFIASPEQQQESDSLRVQFQQLAELMALADSLAATDATLLQALQYYKAANQISPDGLIRNKIRRTEDIAQQKFNDYKNRAANILEYGGCTHALPLLKTAQQLNPEDESVRRMIRRCGNDS